MHIPQLGNPMAEHQDLKITFCNHQKIIIENLFLNRITSKLPCKIYTIQFLHTMTDCSEVKSPDSRSDTCLQGILSHLNSTRFSGVSLIKLVMMENLFHNTISITFKGLADYFEKFTAWESSWARGGRYNHNVLKATWTGPWIGKIWMDTGKTWANWTTRDGSSWTSHGRVGLKG